MARTVGTKAEAIAARLADQAHFRRTGMPVVGPNDAVPTPRPGGGIEYTSIDKAVRTPKRKVGDTGFKKVSGVENRYIQLVNELKRILKQVGIPQDAAIIGGSGLLGAMNIRDVHDLDVQLPLKEFEKLTHYPGARLGRSKLGSPLIKLRTPVGEFEIWTGRTFLGGRDFSNPETVTYMGMQHWDLPTTLDFKRRMGREKDLEDIARFSKKAETGVEEMLPLLAGLTLGLGTGRSLAGHTAAEIAPYGRKTRSEEVARKGAWVGAPAGGLAALWLAKKYGLTDKMLGLLARKAPGGLVASPAAEGALIRTMSPLALALAGGSLGGLATGGLTGLIQRIRGTPTYRRGEKKEASAEDVQRVFEGQNVGDEDIPLVPRSEGWKVVKEELEKEPNGVVIQKTTRVRTFGRLKTAFFNGFFDELELLEKQAEKAAQGVPSRGELGVEKAASLRKTLKTLGHLGAAAAAGGTAVHLHRVLRKRKKETEKKAASEVLDIFRKHQSRQVLSRAAKALSAAGALGLSGYFVTRRHKKKKGKDEEKRAGEKPKMLIEPHRLKMSKEVEEDPFYRIRQKLKIISGKQRGSPAAGPAVQVIGRKMTGKGLPL